MRWIILLPLFLAACGSDSSRGKGATSADFEWRQDVKRSTVASGGLENHVATCPAKMLPVAGGFSISQGQESFVAITSKPDGNKWRAIIRNVSATSQPVELIVFISCVAN